jgi:hypothetical protein
MTALRQACAGEAAHRMYLVCEYARADTRVVVHYRLRLLGSATPLCRSRSCWVQGLARA